MKRIRAAVEADLGALVELFGGVFARTHAFAPAELQAYFRRLFFENPWLDPDLPSLVYEEDGRVTGFLGAIPRPMCLAGRPIRLVISNHFMVAQGSRSTLAAVELMRALFSGPQDLTIAETSGQPRKIWEGLGGQTSLLYSLYWTRPLRPARFALSRMQDRLAAPLARLASPICALFDAAAAKIPGSPMRIEQHGGQEEPSNALLAQSISEKIDRTFLRPVYSEQSLSWLLSVVDEKKTYGTLQRGVVRDSSGGVTGWYLYFVRPGGYALVLHFWSARDAVREVLSHLIYHAWKRGAVALTGRLEPAFMQEFSDSGCLIHRGDRAWMLVHSRDAALLQAFDKGKAFISHLEGEWWVSYRGG